MVRTIIEKRLMILMGTAHTGIKPVNITSRLNLMRVSVYLLILVPRLKNRRNTRGSRLKLFIGNKAIICEQEMTQGTERWSRQ